MKYLGETELDVSTTPFKDFQPEDWAMYWVESYGQDDGDHHKAWVIDQIARILKGTPVIVKLAQWDNGQKEYRVDLDSPSFEYLEWVTEMKAGEHGPLTYSYNEGIAP